MPPVPNRDAAGTVNAEILRTAYILEPWLSLRLEDGSMVAAKEGHTVARLPLNGIEGVVCCAPASLSGALISELGDRGLPVTVLDRQGRFAGRLESPETGNVLLRVAQIEAARTPGSCMAIAGAIVAAKVHNSRVYLRRLGRDIAGAAAAAVREDSDAIRACEADIPRASDLDALRGIEGEAARVYFHALGVLLPRGWAFDRRERRPPRSPFNALLSYLYTIATARVRGAAEGAGLDPQVGFLHGLRPGRASLALDIVEELRSQLVDRLAMRLVRLRVLEPTSTQRVLGGVWLDTRARKTVSLAYAERGHETVRHRPLRCSIPWQVVPHVQARLMARHLRGDLPRYMPFQI